MPVRSAIGSSFDDFLDEEGLRGEAEAHADLVELALKLEARRKELNLSKSELAKRMATSRSAVDRLLDPTYAGLTMDSLRRAASALDCRIAISLLPRHSDRKFKPFSKKSRASA